MHLITIQQINMTLLKRWKLANKKRYIYIYIWTKLHGFILPFFLCFFWVNYNGVHLLIKKTKKLKDS